MLEKTQQTLALRARRNLLMFLIPSFQRRTLVTLQVIAGVAYLLV